MKMKTNRNRATGYVNYMWDAITEKEVKRY